MDVLLHALREHAPLLKSDPRLMRAASMQLHLPRNLGGFGVESPLRLLNVETCEQGAVVVTRRPVGPDGYFDMSADAPVHVHPAADPDDPDPVPSLHPNTKIRTPAQALEAARVQALYDSVGPDKRDLARVREQTSAHGAAMYRWSHLDSQTITENVDVLAMDLALTLGLPVLREECMRLQESPASCKHGCRIQKQPVVLDTHARHVYSCRSQAGAHRHETVKRALLEQMIRLFGREHVRAECGWNENGELVTRGPNANSVNRVYPADVHVRGVGSAFALDLSITDSTAAHNLTAKPSSANDGAASTKRAYNQKAGSVSAETAKRFNCKYYPIVFGVYGSIYGQSYKQLSIVVNDAAKMPGRSHRPTRGVSEFHRLVNTLTTAVGLHQARVAYDFLWDMRGTGAATPTFSPSELASAAAPDSDFNAEVDADGKEVFQGGRPAGCTGIVTGNVSVAMPPSPPPLLPDPSENAAVRIFNRRHPSLAAPATAAATSPAAHKAPRRPKRTATKPRLPPPARRGVATTACCNRWRRFASCSCAGCSCD
jgi:hypothetical protein